jgi:hypothetical protein
MVWRVGRQEKSLVGTDYIVVYDMIKAVNHIRPSAMAGYLTSYYDVERQIGEKIVTSDEQIAYLFHVVQEYVR